MNKLDRRKLQQTLAAAKNNIDASCVVGNNDDKMNKRILAISESLYVIAECMLDKHESKKARNEH